MKKLFLFLILLVSAVLISGCVMPSASTASANAENQKITALEAKVKALESKNKKLEASIEKQKTIDEVYKAISECKEKALIGFIDGNTGVEKTTLKDAFERCDAVFSTMKVLAETQG